MADESQSWDERGNLEDLEDLEDLEVMIWFDLLDNVNRSVFIGLV